MPVRIPSARPGTGPAPRHLHDPSEVVQLRPQRVNRLEFSGGADWSEAGIGTNAISQVLVTGGPVQLFSAEHLVRTTTSGPGSRSGVRLPR
jgi:hypothetical protein